MLSPFPYVQEESASYHAPFRKKMAYEIGLRTVHPWLQEVHGAHRLIGAFLQAEASGRLELLDLAVWTEGFLSRFYLGGPSSLSQCLGFLKEKAIPPGEAVLKYWEEEPQWIKWVPEMGYGDTARSFLERASHLGGWDLAFGHYPGLLFYYRSPRLPL
jgi:hypothetical protein